MALGLLSHGVSGMESCNVFLTIFDDAVKAEVEEYLRRAPLGWFRDEVCAIAAACERAMMRSAILPELRTLPKITVQCERKPGKSGHDIKRFARATVVKPGERGRRVVLLPCANEKEWIK